MKKISYKSMSDTLLCLLIIFGGFILLLLSMFYINNAFVNIAFAIIWTSAIIYSVLYFEFNVKQKLEMKK